MKFLIVIFLLCILQNFVIGRSVVKRNCNSNCCNTNNCNNNNNCNNGCNSNCNNNCQNCECVEPEDQVPVLVPFPPSAPNPSSNITNVNKYNFTADITLTNVINTINNVSIPITLNNTNINRITIQPVQSNDTNLDIDDGCCIVVHPRTCDQNGCYVRRHRECSPICTGRVITVTDVPTIAPTATTPPCYNPCLYYQSQQQPCPLQIATSTSKPEISSDVVTTPAPCASNPVGARCNTPLPLQQIQSPCPLSQPVPPMFMPGPYIAPHMSPPPISFPQFQQPPQQNCQLGGSYPYSQCGNRQTLNCQGCYFCNGRFNPEECAYSPECPYPCRTRGQYYRRK